MGTLSIFTYFTIMLFFIAYSSKIWCNFPKVPMYIFGILGHHVPVIHTHFLWSTNLSTQISLKTGVTCGRRRRKEGSKPRHSQSNIVVVWRCRRKQIKRRLANLYIWLAVALLFASTSRKQPRLMNCWATRPTHTVMFSNHGAVSNSPISCPDATRICNLPRRKNTPNFNHAILQRNHRSNIM